MKHNQYILDVPLDKFKELLSISDNVTEINPAAFQTGSGIMLIVTTKTPLKPIKGKMIPTVRLGDIQKKKPGRPAKKGS